MMKIEDHCVGCPPEMGCIGSLCPYNEVEVHYCDRCGAELDDIYRWDDEELCEECLLNMFRVVD
jgi:hypothetical protein